MISRRRFLQKSTVAAASVALTRLPLYADTAATDPRLLEKAKMLLRQAPLIDTHNDLPSMILDVSNGDLTHLDLAKEQPTVCADIPRLRQGCVGAQYWSIYVDAGTQRTHNAMHEALREFDVALRFIHNFPDFELATTADEIEHAHKAGRIASLMGVEGGHMIENSTAALRVYYDLGARYMTLTHFDNVDWADASNDRPLHYGLTDLGREIVREMNRLGMFVDLSHVSADTMRDAIEISRAPVLFSHSNAYAICAHPRCVPDDVLRTLPKNGGVVHVNFIPSYVAPNAPQWAEKRTAALREAHAHHDNDKAIADAMAAWIKANPEPRGSISEVADHIDHIRSVAGIDHIGIGADYDEVTPGAMVEGLDDCSRYPYLFAELLRRGYSDEDVLKIAGRNHLRAMRAMEQAAASLKSEAPAITPH
ncbi:MAG TPA: dipeptidase [Acidobacteriaceae bacterium]|nr:dipeptidase [Acidobacteriaceae bacterium]